jgi:hypothetical protein
MTVPDAAQCQRPHFGAKYQASWLLIVGERHLGRRLTPRTGIGKLILAKRNSR